MNSSRSGDSAVEVEGASAWFVPWRFALLLVVLILVSFPEVVVGWRAFFYIDAGSYGYPAAFFDRESFWRGELPLWNPYNNCGIPFLAQWNTMALYPPSLFYLIFPLPWSFDVFCLGHLLLAGMGMYFLARRWTGSPLAAALAGVVFAFNGLSWYSLMWANIIAALGWMPWVILGMERAWREGGRFLPLAALAAGLQLLTGGAEVVIVTWLFLGVLWAAQMFRPEASRMKMVGRLLLAGGLSAGLAAAQLLPFLELLSNSQRSASYGDANFAALPATGWANYLVPLFHCSLSPQGVPFLATGVPWTGSYYLGVGVVALALLAAFRAGNLRARVLTGLAVFSLLMALGGRGRVYDWVKMLAPFLGLIRFPSKFLLLTTFVLPLLAACGLSRLLAKPPEDGRREWRRTLWIAAGLLGLILAIMWAAVKHPLPADEAGRTARNGVVRILFFALTFGCLALLRRAPGGKAQRLWQTCLILLLWFDVFTHAPDLSPTVASTVLQPDTIRQFFKWDQELRPGVSRAMQRSVTLLRMTLGGYGDAELDVNGRRLALYPNINLLDHAARMDGLFPLELKQSIRIRQEMYLGTNQASRLKDFLGISLTGDPTNLVGWTARKSFLPMVTSGQKPVFADDAEAFPALFGAGFEPLREVYLPPEASREVHATNSAKAEISSLAVSNQRVTFEVVADATAMVVVAQTYYRPWHAYVDGRATTLWRANYAFDALEVPAGKHQVNIVYEDRSFWFGCALSLASLSVCCVMCWHLRRKTSVPCLP